MAAKHKLIWVEFLDHATHSDTPITCQVVGWLLTETKGHILISHWRTLNLDESEFNANLEKTVILKSCIIKRRVIREPK